MKKYTDVDIIAELQKLVDSHVDSYKEDFDIDKRIIRRAAESQNPEDKTLMWFCRPHGTHCLNENQVFIQGTRDHNTFRFYAEQTYDECIARVICKHSHMVSLCYKFKNFIVCGTPKVFQLLLLKSAFCRFQ